ncbi:MAG TPA: serine hydrolase domain-containing protein [Gemmatimonadales bacterium]|nr:serine hydrolase domain-containing protein [Gemmatimonadales bacterium]
MRLLTLLLLSAACGKTAAPAPPAADPLIASVDSVAAAFMKDAGVPGLAVGILRPGHPNIEKGYGVTRLGTDTAATDRTVYHMASISKPFVATGVMQLVEAGKVELDAPLSRYITWFRMKDPRGSAITVRQLLTHVSGMPDVTNYDWEHPQYDAGALERYIRGLADSSLNAAPGETWDYSNIGFEVLAELIAVVSGQEFETYVREHILVPAGMTHSTMLMTDIDSTKLAWGHLRSDSGVVGPTSAYPYNRRHAASSTMHSDAHDMLRWARINLNRGELDGQRILKTETYDQLWSSQRDMFEALKARAARAGVPLPYESFHQGLSWFVLGWNGHRLINHSGGDRGFRTDLFIAPDDSVAVVVMANQERADVGELARQLLGLVLK